MTKTAPAASAWPMRVFPVLTWLPRYKASYITADLFAGLTLWGLLIPEGLAYAGMAGAPVEAGLYTLLASLPLYFLFGESRMFVCASTSSSSIMMAAVVAPLAGGDPARYAVLLLLLVLVVGVLFLLAGLFRLGAVSAFLSEPVMTGFVFGMAVFIAASQAHKVFGLPKGSGDTLLQLAHMAEHILSANPATTCVGLGALALLFVMERALPRLPAGLFVLALGIGAAHFFNLETAYGVSSVGVFPPGPPHPAVPAIALTDLALLAPGAAGVALVAFSQALGTAGAYAAKFGQEVDADRELVAMGLANIGSFFLGGLVNGGSMSSTAVNDAAGARTQLSTLAAGFMTVLTLFFLTPLFHGLPEAVLGAIVIHAVVRLMKVREMARFFRWDRQEFGLALIALSGVVCLNIFTGLMIAVAASLLRLVWRASKLRISVMGILPGLDGVFVSRDQHATAREIPGVTVLRLDGALFFANTAILRDRVRGLLAADPKPRAVALWLAGNAELGVSSAGVLLSLARQACASGVILAFISPAPKVAAMLRRSGVAAVCGEDRFYPDIRLAVRALTAGAAPQTPCEQRRTCVS